MLLIHHGEELSEHVTLQRLTKLDAGCWAIIHEQPPSGSYAEAIETSVAVAKTIRELHSTTRRKISFGGGGNFCGALDALELSFSAVNIPGGR